MLVEMGIHQKEELLAKLGATMLKSKLLDDYQLSFSVLNALFLKETIFLPLRYDALCLVPLWH